MCQLSNRALAWLWVTRSRREAASAGPAGGGLLSHTWLSLRRLVFDCRCSLQAHRHSRSLLQLTLCAQLRETLLLSEYKRCSSFFPRLMYSLYAFLSLPPCKVAETATHGIHSEHGRTARARLCQQKQANGMCGRHRLM